MKCIHFFRTIGVVDGSIEPDVVFASLKTTAYFRIKPRHKFQHDSRSTLLQHVFSMPKCVKFDTLVSVVKSVKSIWQESLVFVKDTISFLLSPFFPFWLFILY